MSLFVRGSARPIFVFLLSITLVASLLVALPSAPEAQAQEAPSSDEVKRLRTATSTTVRNPDGTFTTSLHSSPIHYRHGGEWKRISSRVVQTDSPGYAYGNKANSFRSLFKSQLLPNFTRLRHDGMTLSMSLEGAARSTAISRGERLAYPAVFPSTDLRYDILPDGVKETFVLNDPAAPTSYRFVLRPSDGQNVTAAELPDGSWGIYRDGDVAPSFLLHAPEVLVPIERADSDGKTSARASSDSSASTPVVEPSDLPELTAEASPSPSDSPEPDPSPTGDGVEPSPTTSETPEPALSPTEEPSPEDPSASPVESAEPSPLDTATPDVRDPNAIDFDDFYPVERDVANMSVVAVEDGLQIDLELDAGWLASKDRSFPVLLDPTITVDNGVEDGNWNALCATCQGDPTGDRLKIGTDETAAWRSAFLFDLGDVPSGVVATEAKLNVFYDNHCLHWGQSWCSGTHQLDLHQMTSAWTIASTTADLVFDPLAVSSYSLSGHDHHWMSWGMTSTFNAWLQGTQTNHGLMLKRSVETLSAGGPRPLGRRYVDEPTLRPKLEVTYSGDAVLLDDPAMVHSNGAELSWERFSGGGSFTALEVHRSADAGFSPSAATRLATITDPAIGSFIDTTAAPDTAFTYRLLLDGSVLSNKRTVTLPPDGQGYALLHPGPDTGVTSQLAYIAANPDHCNGYGDEASTYLGTKPNGDIHRPILRFDLSAIPQGATVTGATLGLFRAAQARYAETLDAHRVTSSWVEGSGANCVGDGATWKDRDGGMPWTSPGGDFISQPAGSTSFVQWDGLGWDQIEIGGLVQDWVGGTVANNGVIVKLRDETIHTNDVQHMYTYRSDDYTVAPTLRPKLKVTFNDGSSAQGPSVSLTEPSQQEVVSGQAVRIAATASDDGRVASVDFLVDDISVGSDSDAPFATDWDTTASLNGAHQLTARATDDAGNETLSSAVSVTVDNSALPSVSVSSPTYDSYSSAVLADVPVGYWRLGEASALEAAADVSGNGHHGTYRNNVTPGAAGALFADGDTSVAIEGLVEKDDVLVPDHADLDFARGDFTAEAWIRTDVIDSTKDRTIVGKHDGTSPYWVLNITNDSGRLGHVRAKIDDGSVSRNYYGPAVRVDDGRWHHVAAVFDRDVGATVYVDGVGVTTTTTAPKTISNAAPFRMGDTYYYIPLKGDIDEVALYPSALTTARIEAHYAAGTRYVSGVVPVAAQASDDQGVAKVEFFFDDLKISEDTTSPYEAAWDTLDVDQPAYDGSHELTARATDSSGQAVTSQPVAVNVANSTGTRYQASFTSTAVPPVLVDEATTTPEEHGIDVTVTNASTYSWAAGDASLHYRWISPDAPAVFTDGPAVALGALAPGASETKTVMVTTPELPTGVDRARYTLRFDLKESATGSWFASKGNAPKDKPILVNREIAAEALGLEHYYHYETQPLGAGLTQMTNVGSGNSLLNWTPFESAGRGLNTVADLTYNSLEKRSDSPIGNNFSLSISSLLRFGLPLDIHPNKADEIAGRSNRYVTFTDGDGTTHRFEGHQAVDGTIWWEPPPGVHLFLRTYSDTDPQRKWALTRPDRVTFFFDADGYPSFVRDGNGNELSFTLEDVPPAENPGGPKKRVVAVTDAAGQGSSGAPGRSFDIDYYTKTEAKKPQIRGKVERLTDHDGSALDFFYYNDGNLRKLILRGGASVSGSDDDRVFTFTYTTSSGDGPAIPAAADRVDPDPTISPQSTRLYSVSDPKGKETIFTYYGPGTSQDRWKLASVTDRAGATTAFTYDIVAQKTTVAAPEGRTSAFTYDTEGKVTTVTDPMARATQLVWTADRQVKKVIEPSGEFVEFAYNDNGYLTDRWDQLRNHTILQYENLAVKADGGAADARDASAYWPAGRTIPHLSQLQSVTDPDSDTWSYAYDASGNVDSITDPESKVTTLVHNSDGTLASMTDPRTNATPVVYTDYDANGLPRNVSQVVDGATRTTKIGYTGDGLVSFVQDPMHASLSGGSPQDYQSRIYYNSFHEPVRQTQPLHSSGDNRLIYLETSYDRNGNVAEERDPGFGAAAAAQTYDYDLVDRLVRVTNRDTTPEVTELHYDPAGRLTKLDRPKGVATTAVAEDHAVFYDHDDLDRVVAERRHQVSAGVVTDTLTTRYCYDLLTGDLAAVIAPEAAQSETCASPVTAKTFAYDLAHRLASTSDEESRTRSFTYHADGKVHTVTNENSDVTTYTYDQRDLVTKVEEPFDPASSRIVTSRFAYDAAGNLATLITPRAHESTNTAALSTNYVYNEAGELVRTDLPSVATAGGSQAAYQHRSYDLNGRLKAVSLPVAQSDPAQVAPEMETRLTYLDPGWIRTQLADGDTRTTFTYNARGQQETRLEEALVGGQWLPDGGRQQWNYYGDGLLHQVKHKDELETTYEYDVNNALTKAIDHSGASNGQAQRVEVNYDAFDRVRRVLEWQGPAGQTEIDFSRYVYDRNSNLAERFDDGRLERVDSVETVLDEGRHHVFGYDQSNRLTQQLDEGDQRNSGNSPVCTDDRKITYSYEPTGAESERNIAKRTDSCSGTATYQDRQRTTWSYFDNGKLKEFKTQAWDANANPAALSDVEHHVISYLEGGIYMNGHRTTDTFTADAASGQSGVCAASTCTIDYDYDERDRLLGESRDWMGGPKLSYTLDPAGNVLTETKDSVTRTFSYTGNRLDEISTPQGSARYLYSAGNLDCITLGSYSGSSCPTSDSGALISDYDYDALDRLAQLRKYDGTTVQTASSTYQYDALDRVQSQTEDHGGGGRTTTFSYLGTTSSVTSEERSGGNDPSSNPMADVTKTFSYDALGRRISMTNDEDGSGAAAAEEFTYGYDTHGSVSMLIDDSGQVEATYGYSGYGEEDPSLTAGDPADEEVTNPYRYTGKRYDTGSGTLDMGARRFSTDAARFLQRDHFSSALGDLALSGDPLTGNRYALAAGNPVSYFEWDGHVPMDAGGTAGAGSATGDQSSDVVRANQVGVGQEGGGGISASDVVGVGKGLLEGLSEAADGLVQGTFGAARCAATFISCVRKSAEEAQAIANHPEILRSIVSAYVDPIMADIRAGNEGEALGRVLSLPAEILLARGAAGMRTAGSAAGKASSSARAIAGARNSAVQAADDAFTHGLKYHARIRKRGLQDPRGHNFPYSFDDVILRSNPARQSDGSLLYEVSGSVNGKDGFFQIGVNPDTRTIFHRTFVGG